MSSKRVSSATRYDQRKDSDTDGFIDGILNKGKAPSPPGLSDSRALGGKGDASSMKGINATTSLVRGEEEDEEESVGILRLRVVIGVLTLLFVAGGIALTVAVAVLFSYVQYLWPAVFFGTIAAGVVTVIEGVACGAFVCVDKTSRRTARNVMAVISLLLAAACIAGVVVVAGTDAGAFYEQAVNATWNGAVAHHSTAVCDFEVAFSCQGWATPCNNSGFLPTPPPPTTTTRAPDDTTTTTTTTDAPRDTTTTSVPSSGSGVTPGPAEMVEFQAQLLGSGSSQSGSMHHNDTTTAAPPPSDATTTMSATTSMPTSPPSTTSHAPLNTTKAPERTTEAPKPVVYACVDDSSCLAAVAFRSTPCIEGLRAESKKFSAKAISLLLLGALIYSFPLVSSIVVYRSGRRHEDIDDVAEF